MTISDVVKTLNRLLDKHGDIEIALAEDQGDSLYLSFPDVIATVLIGDERFCVLTDTELASSIPDVAETFTATGLLQ